MQVIDQEDFQTPAFSPFRNDPLVIHRRTRGQDRAIIIFVHGFGGNRYTTWGKFPQFMFADFPKENRPELDLGFYEYRTAFRRLRFTKSITLKKEAGILADIVRDLTDYRKIILIVHSMGGILAKAAITNLIGRNDPNARTALKKIVGLIMLATPQAGSSWIPPFLAWLTNDTRVLANHNELLTDIDTVFNEHVISRVSDFRSDRILIPTWVVLAAEDLWVKTFSARLGMTSQQQKLVRGSHTEIVKPEHRQSDAYLWVKDHIKACLAFDPSVLAQKRPGNPLDDGISTVEKHVGEIYEELWQAYRPVLLAAGTGSLEASRVDALLEPVTAFALSGPHRREILNALQQLRVLLQENSSVEPLADSVDCFLREIREHEKNDPCFMTVLSDELRLNGRVSDGTRAHIENWTKKVKVLSEDVVTAAGRIRGSEHHDSLIDKEKAKKLGERTSRLVSSGRDMLTKWSFMRGRGDGRAEFIGWLTEARQISNALPSGLDSYRTELANAIGAELTKGDVYAKAQVVYEIMRQLLDAMEF
jgi:pimeloyl-ACP methyl ester carboxylesterase